jgi:hypothetical protein
MVWGTLISIGLNWKSLGLVGFSPYGAAFHSFVDLDRAQTLVLLGIVFDSP